MSIRAAWFVTLTLMTLIALAMACGTDGQRGVSDFRAINRSGIARGVNLAKTTPIEMVTSGSYGGLCVVAITPGGQFLLVPAARLIPMGSTSSLS